MKRTFLAALMMFMVLSMAGCGDGGSSAPTNIVTQIVSDQTLNGDIEQVSAGNFTVTQGNVQSLFAGIDPVNLQETRAFLDFPLTSVPNNAVIVSAFLDIVISSITPNPLIGTIPIRIDLVDFQPPNLVGADFDRTSLPALATTTISPPISQDDFGQHVSIDVTSLMQEAQRLGLTNFQVRILEDLGPVSPGLIEINDTTGPNRRTLAPLLEVTYF